MFKVTEYAALREECATHLQMEKLEIRAVVN